MGDFYYCPLCKASYFNRFLQLCDLPLVNSINDSVNKYPLNVYHCSNCGLVFVNTPRTPSDIFSNYTYFSSWSKTWLNHCESLFWELAEGDLINKDSAIMEIASNDGYMLSNFISNGYNNVLGIEPARNVAAEAMKKGIPTINEFFTKELAEKLSSDRKSDCIIALNVLAHVPDIFNFLQGIKILLEGKGFAVLEFHHLLSLVKKRQFDTIYHEHFSYLSFYTIETLLLQLGMRVFNVEKVPTQGGSLRIYLSHKKDSAIKIYPMHDSIGAMRHEESNYNLNSLDCMVEFGQAVINNISNAKEYIMNLVASNKTIAGYGAAAKAVVFINALGLNVEHIGCVSDINPVKQGTHIPGTNIPVVTPADLVSSAPDYVIIFPWNLKEEISSELKNKLPRDTKFIVFTPEPEIFQ